MYGGMSSRREKQFEKIEAAASKGLTSVTLKIFSSEARRWEKKGFKVTLTNSENNFGIYNLNFEKQNLLNSSECNRFIVGCRKLPEGLTCAERMFLLSKKAIFEQSFID